MVETDTLLTLFGGAAVIKKILGPSADYIGGQLKEWTMKRSENLSKIFKNAEQKIGEKIHEEGKVPSKILKSILDEGSWSEDELQIEYFGGVLASSRVKTLRDDRGICFTSLISRLTAYQLRTHFIFYQMVKQQFDGEIINIQDDANWKYLDLYIPLDSYLEAMNFTYEELKDLNNLLSHSFWGLYEEKLIGTFCWGNVEQIKPKFIWAKQPGVFFRPTKLGIELLLWAFGYGKNNANSFLQKELILPNNYDIKIGLSISARKMWEKDEELQKKK